MCPTSVLRSLYFSLFHSHMSYGLVIWGNSKESLIRKIKSLQTRALKIMYFAERDDNVNINQLHFNSKILKLDDHIKYQMASLMWDYDHNLLPQSLREKFKRCNLIHFYNTRAASKGNLLYPKVNTEYHGIKSFRYSGAKLLNELKQSTNYSEAKSKSSFLKNYKRDLLSSYIN